MSAEPLNPYQANLPTEDAPSSESPSPVEVRLFSAFSVGLATFLGSLFAGSILMGMNYGRIGRKREAIAVVLGGLLATVSFMVCGVFLFADEIPSLVYTVIQVVMSQIAFRILQTHLVNHHRHAGGRLASAWWTVPVAFVAVIPILAIAFGIEGALQLSYGKRIAVGRDEVYISGSATEEDARWLAAKLEEAGWFGGDGATATLHRSRKKFTVSLIVANEDVLDPETTEYTTDLGKQLADDRLGHPLEMRVLDESYTVKQKIPIP